jgi:hypothetical protein
MKKGVIEMIRNVTQVARTYRTNALWHSEEEAWKQRGRTLIPVPPVSMTLTGELAEPPASTGSNLFSKFAQGTAQDLAGVLNAAVSLKQAARTLQANSGASALDRRVAESSSPRALTASAAPGARIGIYSIKVEQIALPQINEGTALSSQGITSIASGSNQMKLTSGAESVPFSIYIIQTDTNQQSLQKIRNAINQTGFPVIASLIQDEAEGAVKLAVTSTNSGSREAFVISDIYGSAALVSGINTVTQGAADALYRVNDSEAAASNSNQVTLDDDKVTLTFHEASDGSIELSIRPDEAQLKQQLQQLISRYNSLHAALAQASGSLDTSLLERTLGGTGLELSLGEAFRPAQGEPSIEETANVDPEAMVKPSHSPWDALGIQVRSDGTLQLDEGALERHMSSRFIELQHSVRGADGVTALLVGAVNRLLALPSEQLLDKRKSEYLSFTNYQFRPWGSLRTYLPVPLSGILLNRFF